MLQRLYIENFVLIEKTDIDFDKGYTVLTGETGAGKSILLDAISILVGKKNITKDHIRDTSKQCMLLAEFSLSENLCQELHRHEIPLDDNLIIKKIVQTNGRQKIFLNDTPVTQNIAKQVCSNLVEIHGQNDTLLTEKHQRQAIDQFIDDGTKTKVAHTFNALQAAQRALADLNKTKDQNTQHLAFLKMQYDDLKKLAPIVNELSELHEKRNDIASLAKIADTAKDCLQHLTFPSDIAGQLAAQQQALARANTNDNTTIKEISETLDRAYLETTEAINNLKNILEDNQNYLYELDKVEERLSTIGGFCKKYAIEDPNELYHLWQNLDAMAFDEGDYLLKEKELKENLAQARNNFVTSAKILSQKRLEIARNLCAEILQEMQELHLKKTQMQIDVNFFDEDTKWSVHGADAITFMVCMNPGQPFTSLSKTASGGEMARVMLALMVVLAKNQPDLTLIFDEIDQGVSGVVAHSIGKRLQILGKTLQVMAITHAAQVAALSHHHFLIVKDQKEKTLSQVKILSDNEHKEELARMLSGIQVNEAARVVAQELIEESVL